MLAWRSWFPEQACVAKVDRWGRTAGRGNVEIIKIYCFLWRWWCNVHFSIDGIFIVGILQLMSRQMLGLCVVVSSSCVISALPYLAACRNWSHITFYKGLFSGSHSFLLQVKNLLHGISRHFHITSVTNV